MVVITRTTGPPTHRSRRSTNLEFCRAKETEEGKENALVPGGRRERSNDGQCRRHAAFFSSNLIATYVKYYWCFLFVWSVRRSLFLSLFFFVVIDRSDVRRDRNRLNGTEGRTKTMSRCGDVFQNYHKRKFYDFGGSRSTTLLPKSRPVN